jgi:hypothetical protein
MNNGKRRTQEEKKAFRNFAINSGLNPYNLLSPTGKKPEGAMVTYVQHIFNKNKVIKHY